MFPEIMFILQLLRRRLIFRIDHFTTGSHLGNLIQYYRIVHRFMCILTR